MSDTTDPPTFRNLALLAGFLILAVVAIVTVIVPELSGGDADEEAADRTAAPSGAPRASPDRAAGAAPDTTVPPGAAPAPSAPPGSAALPTTP